MKLQFSADFLSSSSNSRTATTVSGVVNWISAAGCQRDIQSTKTAVGAAIWMRVIILVEDMKCERLKRAKIKKLFISN